MIDLEFKDRVVVITGAGGGLGRTYALELARRGALIVVNDFGGTRDGLGGDSRPAEAVAHLIRDQGGEAIADSNGVETPEGGAALIAGALDTHGRIDALIHNAGIMRNRSFSKMTPEEWRAVMAVHLDAAFYTAQPAFVAMREAGYGRIVFTTSTSGLFGNFSQANYSAAKMGQVGLMQTLAIEGKAYGIKANAISPTAQTRMTEDVDERFLPGIGSPPEYVTPAAVYLASESCTVSGAVLHASGGFFGRLGMAYNPGVVIPGGPASAEEVDRHAETILALDEVVLPTQDENFLDFVQRRIANPQDKSSRTRSSHAQATKGE